MRDDDDRVREVGEEVLEPVDRLDIEVVRRLVEEQDVRAAEQGLREQHADLLLGREVRHLHRVLLFGDAEAIEQARGLRLSVPAVKLRELCLELRGAHAVLLGEIRLCVERILLVHDLDEALVAHDDRAQDLVVVVGIVVLLQDSEALARRDLDRAAGRLNVACQQFEEGGLTGTVRADDAVAVARRELEVDVLVEDALAKLEADIIDCNHRVISSLSIWKQFLRYLYLIFMLRSIIRSAWRGTSRGCSDRTCSQARPSGR